jgi:anti-sigma factor RsiW
MKECLTMETLERYRSGEVAFSREGTAVERHLDDCARCRAQLRSLVSGAAAQLAASLTAPPLETTCLDEELLSRCADGSLDDVEIEMVEAHLPHCPRCSADVEDLRLSRAELNRVHWAPASPGTARRRFGAGWLMPLLPRPAVWAGGLAAAVVAVGGLMWGLDGAGQRHAGEAGGAVVRGTPPGHGGERVALGAPEALPPEVAEALRTGRVAPPPALDRLIGEAGLTRGLPAEARGPVPLRPWGTVVLSPRPTFEWRAVPGATRYQVVVTPEAEGAPIVQGRAVAGSRWSPPRALRAGSIYHWEVLAFRGRELLAAAPAPNEPRARFEVLEATQAMELRERARRHAGTPLVLGVLYARAGLLDDAERELSAAVRADRGSAPAAKLLAGVRALRGPPASDGSRSE